VRGRKNVVLLAPLIIFRIGRFKTQRSEQDKANSEPTAASLLSVNEQGGSAFNAVLRSLYAF